VRVTIRRHAPGAWKVQVWSISGRAAHTVAVTATYAEALDVLNHPRLASR
jgi:hypothetical protein